MTECNGLVEQMIQTQRFKGMNGLALLFEGALP